MAKGEYVRDTLSTAQKAEFDLEAFNESVGTTKWLGLEIRKTEKGGEGDDAGTVEFIARYKEGSEATLHHELAYFGREEGRWVFADCTMNPKSAPVTVAKVGRNDPCPCGSGKKYKKCCAA